MMGRRSAVKVMVAALGVSLLLSCAQPAVNVSNHEVDSSSPELGLPSNSIALQDSVWSLAPERWELPNGLTVMFLEDRELPFVAATLFLRGGSLWEGAHETGIVGATGELMRRGGAGALNADELDERLEILAANIASSFGQEFGKVSFRCLDSQVQEVFALFADITLRPRFEQDRIALWKGQAIESIRRRVDDPNALVGISFTQLLYGDTPYGRVVVDEDVTRVTRSNLKEAHHRFVRPDGALLAITGKISRALVETLAQKYFGAWESRGTPIGPAPAVNYTPTAGIYFLNQPLEQSTIYMGHLGVPRLTPDYLAIDAFNSLFGSGGFGSYLMRRVRSELGLAYSVYGYIGPGPVKGKDVIVIQTKSDSTAQAIVEATKVLLELQTQLVPESELDETKRSVENSFVFNFETKENVLTRTASQELLGYPKDFDQGYVPGILHLTPQDILEVAHTRWNVSQFVIVVAGNDTAFRNLQSLATLASPFQGMKVRSMRFDQKLIVE